MVAEPSGSAGDSTTLSVESATRERARCPVQLSDETLAAEANFPLSPVAPDTVECQEPRSLRRNARGYPISFVTTVDEMGVENPCDIADDRVHFAYRHHLCGVCGEPLPPGEPVCLIATTPRAIRTRLFHDPPMHPNCARYAFTVCPFLANPKWKPLGRPQVSGRDRPEAQYLYWTYSYNWQRIRRLFRRGRYRKDFVLKAGPPIRIERRLDRAS